MHFCHLTQTADGHKFTILDLFRHKEMAIVSINVGVAFMVNTLVYYGLSFNVQSLAGDLYVNNAINGAVELLAYILCCVLLNILGRRLMLSGMMIGGGVACIGAMLLIEFQTPDKSKCRDINFLTNRYFPKIFHFNIDNL